MFQGCESLPNLDVSNFNTSKVTDMGSMFNWCVSLWSLDIRNADFSSVTSYRYMFNYSPSNIRIIVKDSFAESFVRARLDDKGGVGDDDATITIAPTT